MERKQVNHYIKHEYYKLNINSLLFFLIPFMDSILFL